MPNSWRQHNRKLQIFEQGVCLKKYKIVAGVDESGRGPLAGPVVAAAVVLKTRDFRNKIADCKVLTAEARKRAFLEIMQKSHVGIGIVDNQTIDRDNILQATVKAMHYALEGLAVHPHFVLVDGKFSKDQFPFLHKTVVKGDNSCFSIACASIVAKVVRDTLMTYNAGRYPHYGFAQNRGYGTKDHIRAIRRLGITSIHRKSFRPILGGA